VLADAVVDGSVDEWIAPLGASRFADGQLTPELQVV
jgi:hypothetical protein